MDKFIIVTSFIWAAVSVSIIELINKILSFDEKQVFLLLKAS